MMIARRKQKSVYTCSFLRGDETHHIFLYYYYREREERKTFFDVFTTLGVLFQERRFSVKKKLNRFDHRLLSYNKICKFILIDDDFFVIFTYFKKTYKEKPLEEKLS